MFSLIIYIISIVLAIVATGAVLYYGGSSYLESRTRSTAAKYVNEANQISAALTLYKARNQEIPEDFQLADLAPTYLKTIPGGHWSADAQNNKIVRTGLDNAQCVAVNESLKHYFYMSDADSAFYVAADGDPSKGVPRCDWSGLSEGVPCCYSPSP